MKTVKLEVWVDVEDENDSDSIEEIADITADKVLVALRAYYIPVKVEPVKVFQSENDKTGIPVGFL